MSFIQEFKEFALRGNVVDMAVGVIIGGAFGKIVSSLVADIIMPLLGLIIGGVDLKQFSLILRAAHGDQPAVIFSYGVFLQNIFDFVLIAFSIFIAIKLLNKVYKKQQAVPTPPPEPTKEELLLTDIRDLLKTSLNEKSLIQEKN